MDQKKTIDRFSMRGQDQLYAGDLGCCFTEQYRAMYLSIFHPDPAGQPASTWVSCC